MIFSGTGKEKFFIDILVHSFFSYVILLILFFVINNDLNNHNQAVLHKGEKMNQKIVTWLRSLAKEEKEIATIKIEIGSWKLKFEI